MSGNELKYVSDCVKTSWISSSGNYLERFETEWAQYCGQKYGVGVSNGTVALELAVEVCNFPKGSEIILPSFTIISCAQAIVKNGCVPVPIDCNPETYCMDVGQIEEKITERTVAIMPVHIYGHPCDMDPIIAIAEKHGLIIIEDAAEAHGGEYLSTRPSKAAKKDACKGSKDGATAYWRKCGSFGELSCFSFYANKNITTGEGGMVLTSDEAIVRRLRKHRNLCFLKTPRFLHHELGHNYRMTNIQAAIGLAQLEHLDRTIERKLDMAKKYSEGLNGLSLQLPVEHKWAKNVIWMYSVLLHEDKKNQSYFEKGWVHITPEKHKNWPSYKIMQRLAERGIQTRPFFIGIHEQPLFRKDGYFKGESYPVTEKIARSGFYLPSGQAIKDTEIKEVSHVLKGLLQ
ncbi:MAG: DegT/DnrJ/EryC1/StrS family aminotransferase [Candidatus Omnitrophota bacterium]|nr:MAG: DegT/DnrJ/EryC1/StrS family aminotransferase [Candidatus Omnitrophota bacterium]